MSSARSRLLRLPELAQAPAPDLDALLDQARMLAEGIRRARDVEPGGRRTYLDMAERQLTLAVSSLAIAMLVEPDEYPRAVSPHSEKARRDG
jgi:hypothetical protein